MVQGSPRPASGVLIIPAEIVGTDSPNKPRRDSPFAYRSFAQYCCSTVFALVVLVGLLPQPDFAEQVPAFPGDYVASSGPIHVTLHLIAGAEGALIGNVDAPEMGMSGVQCSDVHVDGQALSFKVPTIHGSWTGFISRNGALLSGTWNQGSPTPLNFDRIGAPDSRAASAHSTPATKIGGRRDNTRIKELDGRTAVSFSASTLRVRSLLFERVFVGPVDATCDRGLER